MSNIRQIKRRVRVARNISQITRAMEMVAASKMKKAQEKAVSGKPYAEKIYQACAELASQIKIDREEFPLLKQNLTEKRLVILIATNKGLCGGLNTNLFRAIGRWFKREEKNDFVVLGKKAENFVKRTGPTLVASFTSTSFLEDVGALANLTISEYSQGRYREVVLVYNNFLSLLKQEPVKKTILPLELTFSDQNPERRSWSDFLIEPTVVTLLKTLLPHYLEVQLRAAVLEAEASEHSARMMAMRAATDNAQELMQQLTLAYNKVRQQVITYEIADIVTAREAIQQNEK